MIISNHSIEEENTHSFVRIEQLLFFIWPNFNTLHLRLLCAKFGLNLPGGSWEEDFYISSIFFAISYLSPLGKGRGPPFEQIWIRITKDALRLVWFNLTQWFYRSRFFKFINVFSYFIITGISPWKRAWPFIWTNLNSHHLRMLYAKFGWNMLSGSREEDF